MDWDRLRIFYAVAGAGSFTHAGERLHLSQSAISRQISALEESLKVSLFHRHARGLVLTEQGEMLYATVREVYDRLAAVENALQDSKERPRGPLKVTTTVGLGTLWLTPLMREFQELYPDITLTLILEDRELDLHMRESDVAIRLLPPRQSDLIQRRLMSVEYGVYASQEYLTKHGMPDNLDDLSHHQLISFNEEARQPIVGSDWLLREGSQKPRIAAFKINSLTGMLRAVESGIGIASLPTYMEHFSTRLIRILPSMTGPQADACFVYPAELRHSRRVRAFLEFMVRKAAEFERQGS